MSIAETEQNGMGVPQVVLAGSKAERDRGSALTRGMRKLALASALMGVSAGALAAGVSLAVNHNAIPATATGLAGGDFTYQPVVFTNGGTASGVTLTQVLPEGIKLNSITGSGFTCTPSVSLPFITTSANKTITCDLDAITQSGVENGIAVNFNVTIPEVGVNWSAVASAVPAAGDTDSDTSDNTNLPRNITTTAAADLALTLAGPAAGTATQFVPFNYVASISNNGPSAIPSGGRVVATFSVPSNTTVNNPGGGSSGWTCTPAGASSAGATVSCSHAGPVSSGANLNNLIIPVTSTATGDVALTVTVSGVGADGSTSFPDAVASNNTDTATVNIGANSNIDLSLTKSASPTIFDTQKANNTVRYTITPRRVAGTGEAPSVRVTDTLPTGVSISAGIGSFTAATNSSWNCASSTAGSVDCTFTGTTPAAGSNYPAVVFDATVNGSSAASSTLNAATVDYGAGSKTADATITGSNLANLTVSKTSSVSPIQNGGSFTYTLTVKNDGPLDVLSSQTITLEDDVPEGVQITSASGDNWTCSPTTMPGTGNGSGGDRKIVCTTAAGLVNAGSSTITLAAVGAFAGAEAHIPRTNTAAVTGVTGRDKGTWNSGSVTTNVSEHQVKLNIDKQVNGKTSETVESGTEVTYVITVENDDETNPSTGIVITDTISNLVNSSHGCTVNTAGTGCVPNTGKWSNGGLISATWVTDDNPVGSGTCSLNGNKDSASRTVTCSGISLNAKKKATVTINAVHFAADGATDTTVTNTASVRSTNVQMPDGNSKGSNETTVTVTPKTDLQVTKVPNPSPAAVGEPITYTLHVYNAGPSKAAGVSLEDLLPANAHWIDGSLSASGLSCVEKDSSPQAAIADDAQGKTLRCTRAAQLDANSQFSLSYRLRSIHDAQVGDQLNNTVSVATTTSELDYANNSAAAAVTLKQAELDVLINMEHTADGIVLGEETEYTITVTNNGPSYATEVTMTDLFPGVLSVGGVDYPSTAIFSFQGITGLARQTYNSVGSLLNTVDLSGQASALCTSPGVDDRAGLSPATPLGLKCVFDKLAPNQTMVIKFKMKAEDLPNGRNVGTIFHNAAVSIYETEWLSDNSVTSANNATGDRTSTRRDASIADPEFADLALVKTASVAIGGTPLNPGEALTYTLTVTNHGPDGSTNGVVTDTLPAGLVFGSAASCTHDSATRIVTCNVGTLAKDGVKDFTITTTIADPYVGSSTLTNRACVQGGGDPNEGNDCSEVSTPVNLPPPPPTLASVSGKVYHDRNDNGLPESGEEGIPGVTITLWDNAGNKVATTTTDANGNYSFTNLQPGTYRITEDQPAGWIDGKERVGSHGGSSPENDVFTGIVLKGGDAAVNYDFGELKSSEASIAGCVYHDANDNGIRDPGEAGIPGVLITLTDADGNERTMVTNAEGCYEFTGLTPGVTYTVTETQPDGWKDGKDTAGTVFDNQEEAANDRFVVTPGEDEHGKQWNFGELKPAEGELVVVKTLYEGRDNGASCGNPEIAKKQLLIVEKVPTTHKLTWCFSVTNTGSEYLGEPVWDDNTYPGMVATRLSPAALPLAPGETGMWYFEAEHDRSVRNVVSVEMPVTDPDGKPVPEVPPASSDDEAEATFGMIYDPPFGVKVGKQEGFDLINWTMVWVNDNLIAADNVLVSDVIKAPMDYAGSLVCVGEGVTTVIGCDYDVATKTVFARANFGADFGKTVANASNRLFISFKVKVPTETTKVENQGEATWTPTDEDGNELGEELDNKTDHVTDLDIGPIDPLKPEVPTVRPPPGIDPNDPDGPLGHPDLDGGEVPVETPVEIRPPVTTDVTPVPVDNPLALLLLAIGVAGVAARAQRRRRSN